MNEIFYKVTLLSDVVLNSNLATEGNMSTLDYIPGSNFLGIVASKLYKDTNEEMYSIFHSGKVRFGDANISENNLESYTLPGMFYTDKLKNDLTKDSIYLDYLLDHKNPPIDEQGKRLQLKQVRGGYFLSDYTLIKEIKKSFAIKSAQDRKTRTSTDGAMFGFESINKGLEFIFSVQFDDESLIDSVSKNLIGQHRLGKSKNAEFGQISIEKMEKQTVFSVTFELLETVLVYAKSNLCFTDVNGMPTFQPTAQQLGLEKGEVDYSHSQIRTHIYSPWNFKRNTNNSQRNCITKGSVFVVRGANKGIDCSVVGLHQAEGLGQVIYNPIFLEGNDDAISTIKFKEYTESEDSKIAETKASNSVLINFLAKKLQEKKIEKDISDAVHKMVYLDTPDIKKLKKISSSQWGGIRAYATKTIDILELENQLFDKKNGYLTHGIADEKYWGTNRGANLTAFKKIFDDHKKHGTPFIAKFAAEMAKESRKERENKQTSTSNSIKKQ
ncbi:MAG: hypothetical protein Q7U47_11450 [Paludibacter sp.]|nr:hypothetical protein [Paludibacter sp.]